MQHAFAWRRAMFASLALVPALALTTAPARAADSDIAVHKLEVHFSNADLSTEKGRARLEHRLQHAAEIVCSPSGENGFWRGDDQQLACYNQAMTQAHTALALAQKPQEMVRR